MTTLPPRSTHPFQGLPKVELHRHLEGSIRLETVAAIAQQYALDLPTDPARLRSLVQYTATSPRTAAHFLSKFNVLRQIYTSEAVIRRVTEEAIEDAYTDGIHHLDLRFSPRALSRTKAFSFYDVIQWVGETVAASRARLDMSIALIIGLNRHESLGDATQILKAVLPQLDFGIRALDLSGREEGYPAAPFAPTFAEARANGLDVTIHAGEWTGASNIREAITTYGCTRIGHGVRVFEDAYTVDLAREHGVTFEVCPTSNLLSGVVRTLADHPLRAMLDAGLKVTINTDDPAICATTLSDEYRLMIEALQISVEQIREMNIHALNAAYMDVPTRAGLQSLIDQAAQAYPADSSDVTGA